MWAVNPGSVALEISPPEEPAEISIFERFNELICEIPRAIVEAKVRSISVGAAHLLLLTEQGTVFCRGDNRFGQLGLDKGVREVFDLEQVSKLTAIDQVTATGIFFFSSFFPLFFFPNSIAVFMF